MKEYAVLLIIALGLLLLLVRECNNRPRPFKDWRDDRQERREEREERFFRPTPDDPDDTYPDDRRKRILPWRR